MTKGCNLCAVPVGGKLTIQNHNWMLAVIEHTEDGFKIVVDGDGRFELPLNYCPECGRALPETPEGDEDE